MKKRNYEKPSMKVVLLIKQPQLLAGSVTSTGSAGFSSDYQPGYQDLD